MTKSLYWIRIKRYFKAHGIGPTIWKAMTTIHAKVFKQYSIIYGVCLDDAVLESELPDGFELLKRTRVDQLSADERSSLNDNFGEAVVDFQLQDRFQRNSSLWLLKENGQTCGVLWSLEKHPIKSYYWPLISGDHHLYANEVFRTHRGRRLNPVLIDHVLKRLKSDGAMRCFIETDENNIPQTKSLSRTPFKEIGRARVSTLFGMKRVRWKKAP